MEKTLTTISQAASQQPMVGINLFDPVQFDTLQRVCKFFAKSALVPDMYRESENNPLNTAMANCMIAVDMAQRIGASPLMIMQNLIIIYGKPSWSSKFLISTVNTCGRFDTLKFRFKDLGMLGAVHYTEYDKKWITTPNGRGYYKNTPLDKVFDGKNIHNYECVAYTTRKGSNELLESSPVTVLMAVKEGWYTKNGSKWQTMTKQMLMYRAASFWTGAYAPELSMGMRTTEEIQDVDYEEIPNEGNFVDKTATQPVNLQEAMKSSDNEEDAPEQPQKQEQLQEQDQQEKQEQGQQEYADAQPVEDVKNNDVPQNKKEDVHPLGECEDIPDFFH